uniref:Uncharacterized protein n=1 Tax=Acrobeloides nanus TaxID=290746 RepID=A0A914C5D5_9BILA
MVLVRRRRAVDLLPQILRHIYPGTTIYSDEWGAVELLDFRNGCCIVEFAISLTRHELPYTEYREKMERVQILRSIGSSTPSLFTYAWVHICH